MKQTMGMEITDVFALEEKLREIIKLGRKERESVSQVF